MKDLMKSFEALEGEVPESEDMIPEEEGAIQDAVLEVIEEEIEVVEMEGEIEEMEEVDENYEESYEQLSTIKAAIEEFGLCKPIAAALGGSYESLHAAGIVPAYEELNDLPLKGTASMEAAKTIGQRIRATWEAVKKFLKNLWEKVKEYVSRFLGIFQKYGTIVKAMKKKVSEGELNVEKLKKKETVTLNAATLAIVTASNKSISDNIEKSKSFSNELESFIKKIESSIKPGADASAIEAAVKKIEGDFSSFCSSIKTDKKYTGIEVKKNGNTFNIVSSSPAVFKSVKKMNLFNAGFKAKADFNAVFDDVTSLVSKSAALSSEIKILNASFAEMDKAISVLISFADKEDEAGKIAVSEKAIKVAKKILMAKKSILTRVVSNNNMISKLYISAARAGMSCIEKK